MADIADKSVSSENKLSNLGYEYNETSKKYTKIDSEGGTIEYMPTISQLKYTKVKDDLSYEIYYHIDVNKITFRIYKDNYYYLSMDYYTKLDKVQCIIGNCGKYMNEINYILSEYSQITNTP